jgi:hypothetical protein
MASGATVTGRITLTFMGVNTDTGYMALEVLLRPFDGKKVRIQIEEVEDNG